MAGQDIRELENMTYKAQMLRKGRMGFSGCDVNAMIRLPAYKSGTKTFNKEKVFQIGTLQTISISTYNAKSPVKAIGFKNPISVARGGRTIAGTLIFNQLHHHVFDENTWPSLTLVNDEGLLTYSAGSIEYFMPKAKITVSSTATEAERAELEKIFLEDSVVREKLKKQWDFSWDTSLMGERMKPSDMPPFDIVILMVNELGQVGKVVLYGVEIVHDSQTLSVEDIYTEVQYQYIARDIEYFHAANFEEASAWKSVTPKYNEVKPKQVTGTDHLDMSPFRPDLGILEYGMSFDNSPNYTDDPTFGLVDPGALYRGPVALNWPPQQNMQFEPDNIKVFTTPMVVPVPGIPDPNALKGPRHLSWNRTTNINMPPEQIYVSKGMDFVSRPPMVFSDAEAFVVPGYVFSEAEVYGYNFTEAEVYGYDFSEAQVYGYEFSEADALDLVKEQMKQSMQSTNQYSIGGIGTFVLPKRGALNTPVPTPK